MRIRGPRGLSPEAWALLPWIVAAFVWFGLVGPMRADQGTRLVEQSRVRRDRLASERAARGVRDLSARANAALAGACRASTDPAALRQGAIAATSGLPLSSFTLSVTGGAAGGAVVEASGGSRAALELLNRLGDPGRGAFLRSATIRDRNGRASISANTGVLAVLPGGLSSAGVCSGAPVAVEPEPEPVKVPDPPKVRTPPPGPLGTPRLMPPLPTPVPQEAPPFTLVGFLDSAGRSRVSVRLGDEVRVISVGDQVAGWTCVSIDRDQGAVFTSGSGARAVLTAQPSGS